jgi:hypothetical protein
MGSFLSFRKNIVAIHRTVMFLLTEVYRLFDIILCGEKRGAPPMPKKWEGNENCTGSGFLIASQNLRFFQNFWSKKTFLDGDYKKYNNRGFERMVVNAESMEYCPSCKKEVNSICIRQEDTKAGKVFICRGCGQRWRILSGCKGIEPLDTIAVPEKRQ